MNIKQLKLRQSNKYLKYNYSASNFYEYVLISTDDDQITIIDNYGPTWENDEKIKEIMSFVNNFFLKGNISTKAFRKVIIDDTLYYKPGVLFYDGSFIEQEINFEQFSLLEVTEKIYPKNIRNKQFSFKIRAFINKDVKSKSEKIKEKIGKVEYNWFQDLIVTKTIHFNCCLISLLHRILIPIKDYIKIGLNIEKISENIKPYSEPKPNTIPDFVFDFVKSLKFKDWDKREGRVGKDGVDYGGRIIENFTFNKYLIYLITNNSDYYLTHDKRQLKSSERTGYTYGPSQPYKEYEVSENVSKKRRREILSILIKHFNPYDNYLYNLEQNMNKK